MGLTLVAVLTAGLLLPGIIAVRSFFAVARTDELDPVLPSLSSAEGIALVGLASVGVHCAYTVGLALSRALPPLIPLPLANPYLLFAESTDGIAEPSRAFSLFAGIALLCVTAQIAGWSLGRLGRRWIDDRFLFGPLADVFMRGEGSDRVIVAYVLGKLGEDGRQIGYQGTVVNMIRDADRFPAKVVLKDASIFYLNFHPDGPERRETPGIITSIALSASEWHNIAFRVFRYEE